MNHMNQLMVMTSCDDKFRDLALYGFTGKEDLVIFRMVYDFLKNLPYSMDPRQKEYVPADFMYMTPIDRDKSHFFKWDDQKTIFNGMLNWGDTRKSAVIMVVCSTFQKMLLGDFPNDYVLKDSDFKDWGIDKMTPNETYNRRFFTILRVLPSYYHRMQEATLEERREILDELYFMMQYGIANRFGSGSYTRANGEIEIYEGSVICSPFRDIEMYYHFKRPGEYYKLDVDALKYNLREMAIMKSCRPQITGN